jgi:putative ABC transport system permease protein
VIFGIFLATLLISQQSAIFMGLLSRSYRMVSDIAEPNIWVVDPAPESDDKLRSLPINYVGMVRSTPGIDWAVPLSSALLPVVTPAGNYEIGLLYGIDDATMIGAPREMIAGAVQDLRRQGAIIVDSYAANGSLATIDSLGQRHPLQLGDTLEINGKRAVVVGICRVTPGFYPQPIIFTASSQFQLFDPAMQDRVGYILAQSSSLVAVDSVLASLNSKVGLQALTREQFQQRIMDFFLKTGILINFGLSVALGIIIGFAIAGQIFYIMTIDNLHYFALIKAVGGTGKMIFQMITFQAALVGTIGFALGIGATVLWGMAIRHTTLAFLFPWQLLLFTGTIVMLICISTAALCIRKVLRADPKMLMGT